MNTELDDLLKVLDAVSQSKSDIGYVIKRPDALLLLNYITRLKGERAIQIKCEAVDKYNLAKSKSLARKKKIKNLKKKLKWGSVYGTDWKICPTCGEHKTYAEYRDLRERKPE